MITDCSGNIERSEMAEEQRNEVSEIGDNIAHVGEPGMAQHKIMESFPSVLQTCLCTLGSDFLCPVFMIRCKFFLIQGLTFLYNNFEICG